MGKGLRSSVNKVNNRKLKKNVFGPVENARTERLSAKLLELASQPKPAQSEMEIEQPSDSKQVESEAKETANANDTTTMDVDSANQPRTSWIKAEKRAKEEKRNRIAKKQKRKVTNQIGFKQNRVSKRK